MHGGTKKQGSKKKDMINWCVLSSRCSDTYAATLRSGMINSGAENLSITALSDAMEVSPSASWSSQYSSEVNTEHPRGQTEVAV